MAKKPSGKPGARKPERKSSSDILDKHTRALARHSKALDAHADAMFAATAATKALTRAQILDVLARRWAEDPSSVKLDDKLSDYIEGGSAAIASYYLVLNSLFPGLHLTADDLARVTKVKDMVEVVFRGLQRK